ncbi:MAG: hypothetical protein AAB875_04470 [Patescibacteria group bacterium]
MRKTFFAELHKRMGKNRDIVALTGDLGYIGFDKIRNDFPDRFINCGASEQAMMGMAVGLALSGKIPVVYSITTFLLYRPFETIRNYINQEKIPVILIGSGRDKDYLHDGFSHWSEEDREVMRIFKNIQSYWPQTKEEIPQLLADALSSGKPFYINLKR